MRTTALALALVLSTLMIPNGAHAADPASEGVQLSLQHYKDLADGARGQAGSVFWGPATATVTLPTRIGDAALIQVSTTVRALGDTQAVLLPVGPALELVRVDGDDTAVVNAGGVLRFPLEASEDPASVILTYRVATTLAAGGQGQLILPLPPVATTKIRVEGSSPDTVAIWPALEQSQQGRAVVATVPNSSAVAITWGSRAGRSAVRRAHFEMAADDSGAGMDINATFEVVGDGALALPVAPESVALLDIRMGKEPLASHVVDGWHRVQIPGTGARTITVSLRATVDRTQGHPRVALGLGRHPITHVEVRLAGARSVTLTPDVPVTTRVEGEGDTAITIAEAHLPPSDEVVVAWTESRAAPEDLVRMNTETTQLLTLEEGVLRSRAIIHYEVIRGSVKELAVALPEGVVPFKLTGDGLEDWRTFAATDDAPRQLRAFLGREVEGSYTLELELETIVPKEEGSALALPLVRPIGAFREMGVIGLMDGDRVGFAEVALPTGYTKAGEDALPTDIRKDLRRKVSQAFKHIGAPLALASAVAAARERVIRFAARVHTLYEVKESSLVGQASVMVELKSGRSDTVILTLPEGLAEPVVTAPSLNRVELLETAPEGVAPGRQAYAVRFTRALEGAITLGVQFEQILPKDLGSQGLPQLFVHGAESAQGSLGITAETGMAVTPGELIELRKVDGAELPKAVRLRASKDIQLGYTFAHQPWSLVLDLARRRTVETRDAVVTAHWVETTLLESGRLEHHVISDVANRDRAFLRFTVPKGGEVLRVAVNGQDVKAVADEEAGVIAVPLPKQQRSQVELNISETGEGLGTFGGLTLTAPLPELRTGDIQWLLSAPADLSLYGIDTEMAPRETHDYRAPELQDGGARVPITLHHTGPTREHLFTYAVHDIGGTALSIGLSYAATPGEGVGIVLGLLALLFLSFVLWRKAAAIPLGGMGIMALIVGLIALGLWAFGWPVRSDDMAMGALVAAGVVVAGLVVRLRRKFQEAGWGEGLSEPAPTSVRPAPTPPPVAPVINEDDRHED